MENEILPTGLPVHTESAMEQQPVLCTVLLIVLTVLKILIINNCIRIICIRKFYKKTKINVFLTIITFIMFVISVLTMFVGYMNINYDIEPVEDNMTIGMLALLGAIIIDTILNIILFYRIKLKNKVIKESEDTK